METPICSELAMLLRHLRLKRDYSVEQLAVRACISASTIYRWENNSVQPRLIELQTVLQQLRASENEFARCLALLHAPRSIAYLRTAALHSETDGFSSWMPEVGDLWRAMRVRQRLTSKQVAQRLRVTPSTVTRWEHSECPPPADRLAELLDLFKALPEEQVLLLHRPLHLAMPLRNSSTSLDECEHRLNELREQIGTVVHFPGDLFFLVLESQLWSLALKSDRGRLILARAYTYHAEFLMWRERLTEMNQYALRALTIFNSGVQHAGDQLIAHRLTSHYVWRTESKRGAHRALKMFAAGQEFAKHSAIITFYRDMAEYAGSAGQVEQARDWLGKSRQAAEHFEDEAAMRLANLIEARVLLNAGRAIEAVPLLASDDRIAPCTHIFEQLVCAETLLHLGDTTGAEYWLQKFYAIVDEHDIEHQRWQGDLLASKL